MGFLPVCLAVVTIFVSSCYYIVYFHEDLNFERINNFDVAYSPFVSSSLLLTYRILCFLVCFCSTLTLYFDKEGLTINVVSSRQESHGASPKIISAHFKHIQRFYFMTVWSWQVILLYFVSSTILSFCDVFKFDASNFYQLKYFTWILYEVAFAMSLLVSIVTTYILIPGVKKRGLPIDGFFQFYPLLFHNFNLIFMVLESILNSIPFEKSHIVFIGLYGVTYCLFAWYISYKKGYFLYFFLDYNQPYAFLWYSGLILMVR